MIHKRRIDSVAMKNSQRFNKNDKILIIGGTGFIGRHLMQRCLHDTSHITCIGYSQTTQMPSLRERVEIINADLRNKDEVGKILQNRHFEYVFNLSGYIDHSSFFLGGRSVVDVHYVGLMNILESLDRSRLKKFVQVGSSDEYGGNRAPQHESMRENPIAPYSVGKTAATHLIQMLSNTEEFPGVILRFFLVYGPEQDEKRFLPLIIKACIKDEIFKTSEGKQLRDFCYIDDVVRALVMSALTDTGIGEIINIASGIPVSIRHMVEMVMRLTGGGKPSWGVYPYRSGENMELYADITKAKSILHWEPEIGLEQGLQKTIQYYASTVTQKEGM